MKTSRLTFKAAPFLICLAAALLCWAPTPGNACRYSVRDVGFVELDPISYRLFLLVDNKVTTDTQELLLETAQGVLLDSNTDVELVNIERQPDHLAMYFVKQHKLTMFPAAALAFDPKTSTPVALPKPGPKFAKRLRPALEAVLFSPIREAVAKQSIDAYAMILIVESEDAQANKGVRKMADGAVARVAEIMDMLPKQIKNPPLVKVLPHAKLKDEETLLWFMTAVAAKTGEAKTGPSAIVFYGRGRQIGPILRGADITESRLFNMLFIIGQDCECGLDRIWMQGAAFPHRYDEKLLEKMTEALGFDPENPMVQVEMRHMLSRGGGGMRGGPFATPPGEDRFSLLDTMGGGYSETVVDLEGDDKDEEPKKDAAETTAPK